MKRDYYESVFEEERTQKLSTLSFIFISVMRNVMNGEYNNNDEY